MSDAAVQLVSALYHENLLREMCLLRTTGHLCDIVVQVAFEGEMQEFEAHKVVLAASSGYFKKLLLVKEPPTKVVLGALPAADFARFLEFAYTARLEIRKDRTCNILEMAKILECPDLFETCNRLTESVVPETGNGVVIKTDIVTENDELSVNTENSMGLDLNPKGHSSGKDSVEPSNMSKNPVSCNSADDKEVSADLLGRRVSNRLAGRRVVVALPKRRYVKKLKEENTAFKVLHTHNLSGKSQSEDAVVRAQVGSNPDARKVDVAANEASSDALNAMDADAVEEVVEGDHNDEDVQSVEGESSTGDVHREQRRKRSGQFKCEKCLRSFHYEKSYLKHIKASHGDVPEVVYRCGTCQQTFVNRCNLKVHEQHVHSDERLFPCEVCSKAFKRKKDVKRHTRQVHEGGGDRHFCPVCGKALSSKTALVLHERTHTGDRPYECLDCGAKFSQSSALKTHRRTHTGEKPFSCDQCDARFTQNHMLAYHRRCHTGERPYMCESCGKSFASKEYLKHHARIHSGSKPYKCDLCGRAFAQRNSLHQHTKTHTGERPYDCTECGKQFTQLNALQRHSRIHTGEKPYMCLLCNRTFTDKSTVRRHAMTHDKDTPWKNFLVVLKDNVERGPRKGKKGAEEEEGEEKRTAADEDLALKPEDEAVVASVKTEPISIAGDWAGPGHGAITLLSHTALGSFTVIQTDVQTQQLQPLVSAESVSLPVTVSIPFPVSLSAPASAPPLMAAVAPLSVCTPVSDEVCVTVQSADMEPELELDQAASIATVTIPTVDDHLGVTEDVPVETMSVEMEVSSESVSDATVQEM